VTTYAMQPDPYVIELLVAGDPVSGKVIRAERRAAARVLNARGWSARAIAEQVGMTPRSVQRIRALDRGRS
jgi:hypothetical protein